MNNGLWQWVVSMLAAVMVALLLMSCGGGSDDTQPVPETNTPPVADAGEDQIVTTGSTVQVDGSGSVDADNDPLSYQWTLVSVPEGSTASLSDNAVVSPTFTAERPGQYAVQLVVNDNMEDSSPSLVTIEAWVRFEKTFGGTDGDSGRTVRETSDGGFVIAGLTASFGAGAVDVLLLKTDEHGNAMWSKTLGGPEIEFGDSVQETSDGGFIIAGDTYSFGAGGSDVYLVKTDVNGNELWSQTFGGVGEDYGLFAQETSDDGFIIVGNTSSYGAGEYDVYLVKTDSDGNELWSRTFGGSNWDEGYAVQETSDGGFIIAGETRSFGSGLNDVYLIRTDADGNELWSRTFGGTEIEHGYAIQETTDGGFIIAGETRSFGSGLNDVYLIRTDADGNELWSRTFGGEGSDFGLSVQATTDGGFIIAGGTGSSDLDSLDVYLLKTDADGNELWANTFGGTETDYAYSVEETVDGGFVISGVTGGFWVSSSADVYLIKTDANGNVE